MGQNLIDKKVQILNTCKSKYHKTINKIGVVKRDSSPNSIGVEFEDFSNNASCIGLFWYKLNEIKILDENMEDKNMKYLTGYEVIAVTNDDRGNCMGYYAIYKDENIYKIGDMVVVTGVSCPSFTVINEFITYEEAKNRGINKISFEVIDLVNMTSYVERRVKREEAEEIKMNMDTIMRKMDEEKKYDIYAAQNPELQKMLDKYKELMK